MRSATSSCPTAVVSALTAVLGIGLASPVASACDGWCGSRYSPAYYGPPSYFHSPPTVVYAGPPVYAYSYFSPAYGARAAAWAYGPTDFENYYTAPVNIFRGPRWNYDAAYYSSPRLPPYSYGRGFRRAGFYRVHRPHRAYIRGPIVRSWRRW
jgi:hypothetical protein